MNKVPYAASKYIREHYRGGYLSKVTPVTTKSGKTIFKVEVTENDVIHHLTFNEEGKLMDHRDDPVYDDDYFEGSFYGEEEF
jgi:hypothetical protein